MSSVARPYPDVLELTPPRVSLIRWVSTVDHKQIGLLYIVTSIVFFLLGGIEALLMRLQLAVPRNTLLQADAYNAVFTMHGTTMVFLVVMPLLLGIANYFVPLQIGARDMAFPRLNALSFWVFFFSGLLLNFSFIAGSPPNIGWFGYAPLTEKPFHLDPSVDYWILGLLLNSVGTILTGLNLVVTVAKLRAPGMTAFRIPVFTWMSLVTGALILAALPSLTAAQVMLLFDRYLGTKFFDVAGGGDALLWQHLFWFFGHPEVYIMVLPAFGIISEVTPVFSRKPLFGYPVVVGSGILIAFLSYGVWAHHMFAAGLGFAADAFFAGTSMLIAIPTGIKIFSWLGTMWGGRIRFNTPMLFVVGFLAMFTIGGISGVHFAMAPIDWQTTDSYYVVAHFHYVLFGGSFFAINAGAYYWFPKITGRMLSERIGTWHFWLLFIGFNLTFFPMHIVGLMGMPRRVFTYPDLPGWGAINMLETIGAFIQGAAVLAFLWNVWYSLRHGAVAGDDPWDAWTLEWATSSPPPPENFRRPLPPIESARPLWDLKHEEGNEDGAPDHGEPTQYPIRGEPPPPVRGELVELRAGPGVGSPEPAASGAQDADDDSTVPEPLAQAGSWLEHVHTPVLGTLVFIASESIFFGALIAAFVEYRLGNFAGPGPHSIDVPRTALFSVALFASSFTIWMADKRLARHEQRGFIAWLLATIVLGAVFLYGQATEYQTMYHEGILINANPFTSAFYTLTGFHGLHVAVGLVGLLIVAGLALRGRIRGDRHAVGAEGVSIYWHFVDGVWVVVFSVVYLWSLLP